MEGDNVVNGPGGSRWNPTKEKINLLANLYMQGLRTPSAEQIQLIKNRLNASGHIEDHNVLYWFQNHKTRQDKDRSRIVLLLLIGFSLKTQFFHHTSMVFI